MAYVRVEQRNARLAAGVRLDTVQGKDGQLVNRWTSTGFLAASATTNETAYITYKVVRSMGMVVFDNQARV